MEPQKLYKKVANALAAAIGGRLYKPGEKLPTERELVEQYAVSRPTIREAMLVLEMQGLVEVRHGSGVYVVDHVAPPAIVDIEIGAVALTEARALIEAETAALAAVQITDEEIAELEDILAAMIEENRAARLDSEHADRAFHLAIARATQNDVMVVIVEQLWSMRDRAPLAHAMLDRARKNGMKPTIADHRAILNALKARDPSAARLAMRNHLHRVVDGLIEATEMEAIERARQEWRVQRKQMQRRRI